MLELDRELTDFKINHISIMEHCAHMLNLVRPRPCCPAIEYIYIYVCVYVYMRMHVNVCMYVCGVCVHVWCVYVCVCVCIHMWDLSWLSSIAGLDAPQACGLSSSANASGLPLVLMLCKHAGLDAL